MTATGTNDSAYVFICQGGELEIQALLLAASLRQQTAPGTELVACIPTKAQNWPQPAAQTIELLKTLGCRIESIENPIDSTYGLANKIACVGVTVEAKRKIFLDSDILCMRTPGYEHLPAAAIFAKPADMLTYGGDGEWQKAYHAIGLDMPDKTFTTTVSGEKCPPYFNSGVIIVQGDVDISTAWCECVKTIGNISDKYFQEQAGFALAVAKCGLNYSLLDEQYNYPANLKPVNPGNAPVFCHYHYPDVIRREPVISQYVLQLAEKHPALINAMQPYKKWDQLLRPHRRRKGIRVVLPPPRKYPIRGAVEIPELVLTGIPRSGTSYMCKLLDQHSNCIVINEPPEAVLKLQETQTPWSLACYFRETRMRILNAEKIKNKTAGRRLQEDTAKQDVRIPTRPFVQQSDFILGIKNTQSFLCRIDEIKKAMPNASLIASIRNPFDTIASWKATFEHLKNADVRNIPVGHINDPFISQVSRDILADISAASCDAERRARLWTFLAEVILRNQEDLRVVHYDDLVLHPVETINRIFGNWNPGKIKVPLRPSTIRRKTDLLDPTDREAISDICLPIAKQLKIDSVT